MLSLVQKNDTKRKPFFCRIQASSALNQLTSCWEVISCWKWLILLFVKNILLANSLAKSRWLRNKYLLGHNSANMGALPALSADLERSAPPLKYWQLRCVHILLTFVVKCNHLWQKTAQKPSMENEKPRWGLESQRAGKSNDTRKNAQWLDGLRDMELQTLVPKIFISRRITRDVWSVNFSFF